ncbi:hypothetical protein C9374_004871 [Naegleria lovaniensis]|uniref:TM2 domain-containing protein n=1 Tax=Naegleria lovaniensis TaxID=51637 RepID=A0AA88GL23_NAELO|nr:uncharacterized protein C9374_004871 [Naegleria lovaniensis]KAG2382904.1 hypothetical protein C9374_004871 [Naegleria lovaniensis]
MVEQLTPTKFMMATLFTFLICFGTVAIFFDSPLMAAEEPNNKLYKIETTKSETEGVMPMALNQANNNTNSTPPYICDRSQTQSKLAMFLISFFVGTLAVDRFIMGYTCIGVAKLLVPTCGIWALVDWILILTGGLYMANGCALINDM